MPRLTIADTNARRIASLWHAGQFDPLYAFASSGTIADTLAADVADLIARETAAGFKNTEAVADLRRLLTYLRTPVRAAPIVAPCLLTPIGETLMRWIVTVEDSTDAIDPIEAGYPADPLIRATRTYKTKRGALAYVDRIAGQMRGYFVLEHVVTDDEIYLRCGGLMEADHISRIYEIVGRRYDHEVPNPTISDLDARRIAAEWHGGGGTALYAFVSTGAIDTARADHDIAAELADCIADADPAHHANLFALRDYVTAHGPRPARVSWSLLTW